MIAFPSALCLVFIVLKLTNYIDWSWVWVISPFWISFALVFIVWLSIIIFAYILKIYCKVFKKKELKKFQEMIKRKERKSSLQERLEELQRKQEELLKNKQNNNN